MILQVFNSDMRGEVTLKRFLLGDSFNAPVEVRYACYYYEITRFNKFTLQKGIADVLANQLRMNHHFHVV